MPEVQGPIAEAGKQFVIAGILWTIGTVIFLVAAYKLYQPDRPPCPPEDCEPHGMGHMW